MTDQNRPILEPKTQAFVDALNAQGGKPLYELSYADARRVLEDAQAIEVRKLPADVEDKILPVGPSGEVSVRIYRPKGVKGLVPLTRSRNNLSWIFLLPNIQPPPWKYITTGRRPLTPFGR